MSFIDVQALKARDLAARPGGQKHIDLALKLHAVYEDRSQDQTLAALRALGVGDPSDKNPLEVGAMQRIIDAKSVIYRTPPVRRLLADRTEIDDTEPAAIALAEAYARAQVDVVLADVERLKNLLRQVVVSFAESPAHGSTVVRVFEPYNVFRDLDPGAADTLEKDSKILLQYAAGDGTESEADRYFAWVHGDGGDWRCFQIDGRGDLLSEQQYLDGVTPFGGMLPALMVYDEAPRGRAWLPIPASRHAFAVRANALLADLSLLIKHEAHSQKVVAGARPEEIPTTAGPDDLWVMRNENAKVSVLAHSPQIGGSLDVLQNVLRLWAVSESLPADMFAPQRQILTGPALRVQEAPLNQRRQRQAPLVAEDERRIYEKIARVHNAFASEYGLDPLDETAQLRAVIARPWVPADPKDLQQRYFAEIAVGLASAIDYIMERDGCDRATAIATWDRVQADRLVYAVTPDRELVAEAIASMPGVPAQNPGALIDEAGPRLPGVDATKTPGAMNPDVASSVEGASVSAAAKRAMMPAA